MKKKISFRWNILIVSMFALILASCFLVATLHVNQITTKSCYRTLNDTANQFASDVRNEIERNWEKLEIAAEILSKYDDLIGTEASAQLQAFQRRSNFTTIGILLPDQPMQFMDGNAPDFVPSLDFRTESATVPYVSNLCTDGNLPEQNYLYQAVPVIAENKLCGILYGFMDLKTFSNTFTINAMEGQCDLYLIDGSTGDFIMDTWHDTLGNLGNPDLYDCEVKSGFDLSAMQSDMMQGRAGYFAFRSNSTEEYFYSRYSPAGINRWMVQVTVPESVVFSNARQIRFVIAVLAAVYIVAFLLYFIWLLRRNRKQALQKERQLSRSLYMYDVQQALYDAPKKPELIPNALHIVAEMLTADAAFLMVFQEVSQTDVYMWQSCNGVGEKKQMSKELQHILPSVWKLLSVGKTVLLYPEQLCSFPETERAVLEQKQIRNSILVPVRDTTEHLIGVLGSINMQSVWSDGVLLECVVGNFLMALQNMNSYQLIQKMGTIDSVTGLKNRNSYQLALQSYSDIKEESLCCIYADANGLHELNNHLGHAAGDSMLRYIGDTLIEIFGGSDAYRIGGDEFVVFCQHCSEQEIEKKLVLLHSRMAEKGYHISIGASWLHDTAHMDHLIADAECKMYEAKRLYYQKKGNLSKAREMNRKLEKILLEKKDADNFLRIISSYFMGVYVVNLNTDFTRAIYKPQHFQEKLEKSGNRFLPAMQLYVVKHVHPEDKAGLLAFLNYAEIDRRLLAGENPEHTYRKPNNLRVRVRVYPADRYAESGAEKEMFWLFEEYTE